LLADAALPNVTLQLIPFEYGPHPGLEGSFNILGFPHGQLGEIVFVEGMVGNFIIDKVAVVHRYRMIFDQLADTCALSAPQTIEWLENLLRELTQDGSRGRRSKAPSG
jgi:hypothetical protein